MISSRQLLKILPFTIIFITIYSITPYPNHNTDIVTKIGNTTFWWIIQIIILSIFLLAKKYFVPIFENQNLVLVKLYLIYNLICFFRGVFIAEVYWDWKALIANTFALLMPIIAFSSTNKIVTQHILHNYIKYTIPLFLVFALIISPGAYGAYLVPISFLAIFIPILPRKWKWPIIGLVVLAMFAFLGARSNVIKFGLPLLLMSIFYFRNLISQKIFETLRVILFAIPFIFFFLGITNTFNIFNMEDYLDVKYAATTINQEGEIVEEELNADTRTFLYFEVLQTAKKYNSWWIGRSPARGNETEWFEDDDLTGRGERQGNEVAILNIFTWTGIVGVIFYFLIFLKASYLAINKSNNIFSKILGLFIAFRWLYAWIEDVNYFTLTTFILWMMLGLCLSKSFREMSNNDMKYWIYGIFYKNYRLNP